MVLGIAMWFGRFGVIVPVLAIAGSLAAKKRIAVTGGTMPTHGPLFVVLLIGTVLLVGLLNYVPALALGPVVEHLMLWKRDDMTRKTLPLFDPALLKPALVEAFKKLDPRDAVAQPGDVRRLRRQHLHHAAVRAGARRQRRGAGGFILADRAVAVVHGAVRQLRRGAGRGPQQGAGRLAARPEEADLGQEARGSRAYGATSGIRSSRRSCARATSCWSRPAT